MSLLFISTCLMQLSHFCSKGYVGLRIILFTLLQKKLRKYATLALLNRGARLTEVPKQPQYEPLPIEKQIVVIYVVVNGFSDRMPLDRISQYEKPF